MVCLPWLPEKLCARLEKLNPALRFFFSFSYFTRFGLGQGSIIIITVLFTYLKLLKIGPMILFTYLKIILL